MLKKCHDSVKKRATLPIRAHQVVHYHTIKLFISGPLRSVTPILIVENCTSTALEDAGVGVRDVALLIISRVRYFHGGGIRKIDFYPQYYIHVVDAKRGLCTFYLYNK